MLDTEGGTPAEGIYHRWGWTLVCTRNSGLKVSSSRSLLICVFFSKIGRIPNGEISAGDGMLRDTVYFYKDLRLRAASGGRP